MAPALGGHWDEAAQDQEVSFSPSPCRSWVGRAMFRNVKWKHFSVTSRSGLNQSQCADSVLQGRSPSSLGALAFSGPTPVVLNLWAATPLGSHTKYLRYDS